MKKNLFYLALLLLLLACENENPRTLSYSFYHWKAECKPSNSEFNLLDSLAVKNLYVRYFDVDWDFQTGTPRPLSTVSLSPSVRSNFDVIPTIFITNRTFYQLKKENTTALVDRISNYAKEIHGEALRSIQIDCDWSADTREIFFLFIKKLKEALPECQVSTTLRLHQIKYYQKTGVPPADYGVLMFYNMGNLEDMTAKNSILDLEIAQEYLVNFDKYPLDFDIALPIFSWGILFREEQAIRILNNIDTDELQDTSRFYKADNFIFTKKNTYLNGTYLYENDKIRLEKPQKSQLKKACQLLAPHLPKQNTQVIFYHLDDYLLQEFNYETIKDITSPLMD